MDKKKVIIILLVLLSGVLYYFWTEPKYDKIETSIIKAIDGDTIDTDLGRVRLLGINTPEKEQPFYIEAKEFLQSHEGKKVEIELHGKDKYDRWLGYLFLNNELVNEKILRRGLANLYYYEKDNYYRNMAEAEQKARDAETGLWKKSNNSGCIELLNLIYLDEEDEKNQEQLQIRNNCNFSISAIIKDDANHIEDEKLQPGIFSKNYTSIWNDAGDTLYVRDGEGLLLFFRYPT